MVNFYIFSDPHCGHKLMVELGIRKEGYEQVLMDDIYSTVKPKDVIICLGDLCWGNEAFWNSEMTLHRGKSWLVRGNHDKKSIPVYLEAGWYFVSDGIIVKRHGKTLRLSHIRKSKT